MDESYEEDILLPPIPVKPQKTLFSYFNVDRTSEVKDKTLELNVKKTDVELNKYKNKDKNINISISLFGENAAKKINKKSTKANGPLKKYLSKENNENDEDNIEEDKNNLNEDNNELGISHENIEGNDSQSSQYETTDDEVSENELHNDDICQDEIVRCDNTPSDVPSQEETLVQHKSPNKKTKRKKPKQQSDCSDEELNKSSNNNNNNNSQKNIENEQIINLNNLDKETVSPIKPFKKVKIKKVKKSDHVNNSITDRVELKVEPTGTPNKKVKRKKKKLKQQMEEEGNETDDVDGSLIKFTESPNKVRRRQKRLRQQFDSSDEELNETDPHNDDISCGNKEKNKDAEEVEPPVDSKDVLNTTEKEITNCVDDSDSTCQSTNVSSLHLQKEEEKMADITCLHNNRITPIKVRTNICSVDARKGLMENIKMIGNVYPSTSSSKYKSLLDLTDTIEFKSKVHVSDNLHTRSVEDYLIILQSEYPNTAVKKIFLQLLDCQKIVITKNLKKVISSKKVLETLWERDSKLKSEEIAFAEEMKRKNKEIALAETNKKKKNDIRLSFGRTKIRKKKVNALEDVEDKTSDNVGNKTESNKKARKNKNKKDKVNITTDSLDEVSVVDESKNVRNEKNDIRSSFKCRRAKKLNMDVAVTDTMVDEDNNEDSQTNMESSKKGQKKRKNKKITDMIPDAVDVVEDDKGDGPINDGDKTESNKKNKGKRKNKKITDMIPDAVGVVEDDKGDGPNNEGGKTESNKKNKGKCKNKKITDMIPDAVGVVEDDNGDDSINDGGKTKLSKKGRKESKNKKLNLDMNPNPLEEVSISDNENETEAIKKSQKKCKQKLKNNKGGIMSYLQKDTGVNNKDDIKMESEVLVSLDNKETNTDDKETIVKDFTTCKVKDETDILNSSVLESDCQSEPLKTTCTEVNDDQNVKSKKRKLNRSTSNTRKKLKLSTEKPVTRRRSLRNQSLMSIELRLSNPETSDTSDPPDKTEIISSVEEISDSVCPKNHENAADLVLEKDDFQNSSILSEGNHDVPISTEEEKDTQNLRRSTRVRKKVIEYIPQEFEFEFENEENDENDEKDEKVEEVEDISFEETSKSAISLDDCDVIETTSIQGNNDDVQILKTTLTKAMVTLDLLEQSPRKSPRKPVPDVTIDEDYMNSCLSWTEKYQPNKARYVIGDRSNTKQIFDWLLLWKDRHESAIRKMAKSENTSRQRPSDDSESESEDSEYEDYLCNTMLLTGPCGCGTTATVYACANQLDFKVLELNPSIYRTGKQILDKVSEAVVSHQVNKFDMSGTEKELADCTTDSKKGKSFMSKREKCMTKKDDLQTGESNVSTTGVDAMSLILFEQVDVVYGDIDRGFYQGITDLRNLAKRPIILTANNPQILDYVFPDEDLWIDHIVMTYPDVEKLLPMLQLMCLVEHVFVSKDLLIDIINICKNDVRKIILQLMFWCDQGKKPLFKIWNSKNKKIHKSSLDGDNTAQMNKTDANGCAINDEIVPSNNERNVCVTDLSSDILPVYKDESFLNTDQIYKDGSCSCNSIHGNYSFMKCSVKDKYSAIDHIAATADSISEMNSRLHIDQNYFEMDRYDWMSTSCDSLCDSFSKEKEKKKTFPYPMVTMCKNAKKINHELYESYLDTKPEQINCINNRINISYTDMYKSALHSYSAKYHINRKSFLQDVIPYMNKICQLEDLKLSCLHQRKRRNRRYTHYLNTCGIHLEDGAMKELSKPFS